MEEERECLIGILDERLENHDNNRKIAQGKLHEICEGMKKQIDELENKVNIEMEELFSAEDNRLQTILSNLREITSTDDTEISKMIQRTKIELLVMQSYEIIKHNSNNNDKVKQQVKNEKHNDNDDGDTNEDIPNYNLTNVYELKTERQLTSLKFIDFEERKPTNIISSFTNKGIFLISFSFFNVEEINVLKTVSNLPPFKISIKMWDKRVNEEENAKVITKEYVITEKSFCFDESFIPNTTYHLKMRIEHSDLFTEWSEIIEFVTPRFNELCVWKDCPDLIYEDMKYSVDNNNPRIATKIYNNGNSTIICNTHLPLDKVTSWNIKIFKSYNNNGSSIYIGIATFDINQNDDSYNKCMWYLDCWESRLYSGPPHNYKWKEYGPRKGYGEYVHTGDVVGVVMDTSKGELSFVLKGVNLGVAYEGIPLDKPLVPCVSLYNMGDSVELIL